MRNRGTFAYFRLARGSHGSTNLGRSSLLLPFLLLGLIPQHIHKLRLDRLFFVHLYGSRRPHTFWFAQMGLPVRQQEITDSQHHHHESINKEPAISQHENESVVISARQCRLRLSRQADKLPDPIVP